MQSQGSTSSQPSFDSLSSSDSLLQSDSEQAEDEESVFMAGSSPSVIIGGGGRGGGRRGGAGGGGGGGGGAGGAGGGSVRACGSDSPGSRWTDTGYTDKEEEEEEEEEDRGSGGGRPGTAAGDGQRPKSQGDLLFAKKCAELQGFVNPLLELLSGLKRGRFERGLTGFQQSVAMDRIQRIVGVLQRPSCGEKYLSTLLQVEMMLKLWFPQITPGNGPVPSPAAPALSLARSTPPHKHRDQSHIPVKKRRLSWTDAESPSPSPVAAKRHHPAAAAAAAANAERSAPAVSPPARPPGGAGEGQAERPTGEEAATGEDGAGDSVTKGKPSDHSTGQSSEPGLSPLVPLLSPSKACAPPKSPAPSTVVAASAAAPAATAAAACDIKNELPAFVPSPAGTGSPAMQDSSVTSTTPHKHHTTEEPLPTRCQSPAAGAQQTKGKTAESCPRGSPPPPAPSPPPSRICPPTPLDT